MPRASTSESRGSAGRAFAAGSLGAIVPRLALLGALKHWRRSLVVAGAAAISCGVMIAVGSLLIGVTGSFYDSVIPNSGHIRIRDPGMKDALDPLGLDSLMQDADSRVAAILALGDPRIRAVEPILSFGGLLVEDRPDGEPRNLPMRGIGVEPSTRFADNVRDSMTEGSFLPGGRGVAVSERAARLVGARLGAGLLLLVRDRSAQPWYEKVEVTGIFRTESADFDETTFYIGRGKAAEMLDVPGAAREIRLLLASRDVAEKVASALGASSGPGAAGTAGVEMETWRSINAPVFTLLLFIEVLLGIVMALFAVVAGIIIANTTLVSVTERRQEFGTMRAIGLESGALERLILAEGSMIGILGALAGIALGSAVVALLSGRGMDLGGAMESIGLRRYNRPRPDAVWYLVCAGVSLLVSLAATGKAASTIARKGVAECLAPGE